MDRDQDIAIALLAAQSGLISDGQLREALSYSIATPALDGVTRTLVAKGYLKPADVERLHVQAGLVPTVLASTPRPGDPTPARAAGPSVPTLAHPATVAGDRGPAAPSDSTVAHASDAREGSTATVPGARAGEASSTEPPPSEHGPTPWDPSDALPPAARQVLGEISEDARRENAPLTGRFADFRILRELGRGGMGVVYEAEQGTLGRRVALKVLPPILAGEGDYLERFHTEARSAAKLRHPNIVQVYGTGKWQGYHYIAMELVSGKSLHDVIKTERITPRRAATLTHALADALTYAHANGVIHRDVKPTNVIVGQGDHVYLMDFGLAQESGGDGLTQSGMILGTPSYMSPEQAEGHKGGTDAQSDVYSLGATLYELLTGQPPFTGATWRSILPKVASEEPVPPRKLVAVVPRDLETIVQKAMEKTKLRRYSSMASLRGDLKRWLEGEPIQARPVSIAERLMRKARKNRAATLLGVAVLVVLLTAVGLWWRARERDWAQAREKLAEFKALRAKGDAGSLRAAWDRLSEAITLSREGREFLEAKSDARHEDLKAAIAKEQYDVALLDLLKDADAKVGKYAGEIPKLDELITGIGSLEIHTDPEGASFKIYDFNEKGLWDIQQTGDKYLLAQGTTPWPKRPWPMGEYLVLVENAASATVHYPILLGRNATCNIHVRIIDESLVPEGMVYVPAGDLLLQRGDRSKQRSVSLPGFLIGRTEVTQAEYAEFLATSRIDATPLLPQDEKGIKLWPGLRPPPGWEGLPVFGVTREAAEAYARHVGGGLPTRDQFLRAMLGTGGRAYPWGDKWEPSRFGWAGTLPNGLPATAARAGDMNMPSAGSRSPFQCENLLGNVGEWIRLESGSVLSLTVPYGGDYGVSDGATFTIDGLDRLGAQTPRLRRIGLRVVKELGR